MYHIVEEIGNPAFNPSLVKPKMGPAPNVKVTMKSVANKKITLIQGLENYKVDESVTAKYLQKKCSGASSVGDNGNMDFIIARNKITGSHSFKGNWRSADSIFDDPSEEYRSAEFN